MPRLFPYASCPPAFWRVSRIPAARMLVRGWSTMSPVMRRLLRTTACFTLIRRSRRWCNRCGRRTLVRDCKGLCLNTAVRVLLFGPKRCWVRSQHGKSWPYSSLVICRFKHGAWRSVRSAVEITPPSQRYTAAGAPHSSAQKKSPCHQKVSAVIKGQVIWSKGK